MSLASECRWIGCHNDRLIWQTYCKEHLNPLPEPSDTQTALREKMLYQWLVHDEACDYSMTGSGRCDCIQSKVVDNLMPLIRTYATQAQLDTLKSIREIVGWEEEPDFDPSDATWGDTDHDHNAVVYGRNSAKGEIQGRLENLQIELKKELK